MSTFVTVGNAKQPFVRLINLVRASIDALPAPVFVQHGTAPFDQVECEAAARISATEYRRRMTAAELVICHAGAGCLLDAAVLGKPIIAVPRLRRFSEMVDDHQLELAMQFVERGIIVVPAPDESLTEALRRLTELPRVSVGRKTPLVEKVVEAVREEAEVLGARIFTPL